MSAHESERQGREPTIRDALTPEGRDSWRCEALRRIGATLDAWTAQLTEQNSETEAWLGEALERGDDFWPGVPDLPAQREVCSQLLEFNARLFELTGREIGYLTECHKRGKAYCAERLKIGDERFLAETDLACVTVDHTEQIRRLAHLLATWQPGNPAFETYFIRYLYRRAGLTAQAEEELVESLGRLDSHRRFQFRVHNKRLKPMGHLIRKAEGRRADETGKSVETVRGEARRKSLYQAVVTVDEEPPAAILRAIRTRKSNFYTKDLLGQDYHHYLDKSQTEEMYLPTQVISGSAAGLQDGPPGQGEEGDAEGVSGAQPWMDLDFVVYRRLLEEAETGLRRDFTRQLENRIEIEQAARAAGLDNRDLLLIEAVKEGVLGEVCGLFEISKGRAYNLASVARRLCREAHEHLWEDFQRRLTTGAEATEKHDPPLGPKRWLPEPDTPTRHVLGGRNGIRIAPARSLSDRAGDLPLRFNGDEHVCGGPTEYKFPPKRHS